MKDIHSPLVQMSELDYFEPGRGPAGGLLAEIAEGSELPIREQISRLEKRMKDAAKRLEFEEAALCRDRLKELREIQIYAE